MQVKEIMKNQVELVYEDTSLTDVAKKMVELNIGAIPVRKGDRLVGMITDRDIVTRGVAKGLDPNQTNVKDCMTSPIVYAFEDQEHQEVAHMMENKKVRRLPILNREKRLVGIMSLTDISVRGDDEKLVGRVLRQVTGLTEVTSAPN